MATEVESLPPVDIFAADLNTVEHVHPDDLDALMWAEANPEFNLALLTDQEVDALAKLAQNVNSGDVESNKVVPFDKSFVIVTLPAGMALGIRLVGWYDTTTWAVFVQSYIFVKTPFKKFSIKGPKLEGNAKEGIHVGPIVIPLPYVGSIDIWAKIEDGYFTITIKVVFFGRTYTKKYRLVKV